MENLYKKKNTGTVLCPVLKPDIFAEVFCILKKNKFSFLWNAY